MLVVLDTLSRCSAGADENSNTDMANLLASADLLQQRFHSTVLIVHHAGKTSGKGPRGASSLQGNVETSIEVFLTERGCRVTCAKQKDAAPFEPFSLKMQQIQCNPDSAKTSVVLVPEEDAPILPKGGQHAPSTQRTSDTIMLEALALAEQGLTHGEWKQAGIEAGISASSAKRAIGNLITSGQVQKRGQYYSHVSSELEKGDMSQGD